MLLDQSNITLVGTLMEATDLYDYMLLRCAHVLFEEQVFQVECAQ